MALIKSKCVPKYKLNNVVEAFIIISNMLDANRSLGLTQLCDDTLISKNKAFRLLSTLEQCGIVEKNEKSTYKIGMATIGIARKIMAKTSLLDFVRPYMEGLANEVNEAVYFACYIAGEAMLVDYADCCHPVKATSFVGKVILFPDVSNLDIHGVSLSKNGDITVDVGGLDPDITTVSMPFFDYKGIEKGALVVLAPTFRTPLDRIKKVIVPALREVLQRHPLQPPETLKGRFLPSAHPGDRAYGNHPALCAGVAQKAGKSIPAVNSKTR